MFNKNTKYTFVHSFHISKSKATYMTAICKEMAKVFCKLDMNLLKDGTFWKSYGYFVAAAS